MYWRSAIWFKYSIPRSVFTFWISHYNNRLPLRERLYKWDANISVTCGLCNSNVENRDHLFLHCEFAGEIWRLILSRFGLLTHSFVTWDTLEIWVLGRTVSTSSLLKKLASQAAVYYLWLERNNRGHGGPPNVLTQTFMLIDRSVRDTFPPRRHQNFSGTSLILV